MSAVRAETGRPPAVHFAHTARRLGLAARAAGLTVPAFRSPPRHPALVRSIRYLRGGAVVAIRLHGRTPAQIDADMVDGVLAANRLSGEAARRMRATLLGALHHEAGAAAA
ncbi:MAG TPA: hypothetical protein VGI86_15020 [Acidimicrobiia bacterium]